MLKIKRGVIRRARAAPAKGVYREFLPFFHPLRIRLQICFNANKHKECGQELLCFEVKINARGALTTFRDLLFNLIKVAFQKFPPRKPLIKSVGVMK